MLPATIQNLESIRLECKSMVSKRAIVSGAASLIPLPGADVATDVGMLMELLPSISRKFGLSKEQIDNYDYRLKMLIFKIIRDSGEKIVGQLITREVITTLLKKIGVELTTAQIAKYIPVIGQVFCVTISAGTMKYIGNSHVDDCYKIAKQVLLNQNNQTVNTCINSRSCFIFFNITISILFIIWAL